MFNPTDTDDVLDLDALFQDIPEPDPNMYIANGEQAIMLIGELIQNKLNNTAYIRRKIESRVEQLFALFSEYTIEDKLEYYEQFMELCARLSERNKVQKLQDKVVISFGGKFSAGKSKFINAISGIGELLPVAQTPTTSVPTYIIKSKKNSLSANSVYGYTIDITSEAMNAITHEFYEVYKIGFSSFLDSIIAESVNYSLPENVALLDTPGYTKFDNVSDSKTVLSDRQKAFEQLRISDFLIWLVDIENGGLTDDDIEFIKTLNMKTPILIVFTKADLKTESDVHSIIEGAKLSLERTTIDCFGVTAYSSNQGHEYGGRLITQYINYASSATIRNNDLILKFRRTQQAMRSSIEKAIKQSTNTANSLFAYVKDSSKIMEIQSLSVLWGKANQESYRLGKLLEKYDDIISKINLELKSFIREAD